MEDEDDEDDENDEEIIKLMGDEDEDEDEENETLPDNIQVNTDDLLNYDTDSDNSMISDDSIDDTDVFNDDNVVTSVTPDDIQYDGEAATDIFAKDTEDIVKEPEDYEMDEIEQEYAADFSYKIANVMFNENLKEGTKEKSGSVIIIVPMVDGTGRKYIENKTVEFYLSEDGTPILDNEPMTNELYAAVIDAIKNHPDYSNVCKTGEDAMSKQPTIDALRQIKSDDEEDNDWEKEYLMGDDTFSEYPAVRNGKEDYRKPNNQYKRQVPDRDDTLDELPNWGFEDEYNSWNEDPKDEFGFKDSDFSDEDDEDDEDVIIPTYKDGDTEIEFPAANVDNTLIPESYKPRFNKSRRKISITPEFKNRHGKRFF